MVSQTWTSLNVNGFRIDWPALRENLLHLLAVFHFFVPFIGYQLSLEYCSISVCWPTKLFMKNSLSIFTPCLLRHACPIRELRTIQMLEHFTLVSLEQPATVCPFSHCSCCLQETPEDTSVSLSLSPIVISTPDDPLMLWNCLIDFAVEHRFGLTRHWAWLAGDIVAIEIYLINWLIDCFLYILETWWWH